MKNKLMTILMILSTTILLPQTTPLHELLYQSDNGAINAQVSPNRNYISFTRENYMGLQVLDLTDDSVIEITDEPAAGFGHSWSPSGHAIVYKPALFIDKRRYNSLVVYDIEKEHPNYIISDRLKLPGRAKWIDNNSVYLSGNLEIDPIDYRTNEINTNVLVYNFEKNIIYTFDDNGNKTPILENEKEILDIVLSPNGSKLIYEEYGGDLIIMNINNRSFINLGIGYEAEWSPNGNRITFMRTYDDGYKITQSDIFIVNADGSDIKNITRDFELIAMRPTWYGNTHVVYDTDDNNMLYMTEVQ